MPGNYKKASKSKTKKVNFKRHFSWKRMIIFALAFAVIGYIILRVFAAGMYVPDASGPDRFGLAANSNFLSLDSSVRATAWNDYNSLGVRWIRGDFTWPSVQRDSNPDPNSWNIRQWDQMVLDANAHGVKIMGMATYVPNWAGSYSNTQLSDAYAHYVGALAQRYNGRSGHGRVEAWELWNEPNGAFTWKSGHTDVPLYASMVKKSYDQVKNNAGSDITVLIGGLSGWGDVKTTDVAYSPGGTWNPVNFLSALYKEFDNRGWNSPYPFDAVGWHPYCHIYAVPSNVTWCSWYQMDHIAPYSNVGHASARSVMAAHGTTEKNKKIWMTEFGYPTQSLDNWVVSESEQARLMGIAYNEVKKYSWAGPLFWHNYIDTAQYSAHVSRESYEGIKHVDNTPKPAYATYKQLTHPYRYTLAAGRSSTTLGQWQVTGCTAVSNCANNLIAPSVPISNTPSPKPTIANAPGGDLTAWLYQQELWGYNSLHFKIKTNVPGGLYRVSLHFAEIYFSKTGQRRFNVKVQGNASTAVTNYDILAAAGGPNRATHLTFDNVRSDSSGYITVDLTQGAANFPKISWVDISSTP